MNTPPKSNTTASIMGDSIVALPAGGQPEPRLPVSNTLTPGPRSDASHLGAMSASHGVVAPSRPVASSIPLSSSRARSDAPRARWSWRALLVLIGLWAFAVTQPLLSVLGAEPGFFLVRRAGRPAIVAFAVVLAVVPPLVLWLLGLVIELVDERLVAWYQRAVLAAIVAVAATPPLVDLGLTGAVGVVLALGAGVLFASAYERFDAVALWARFTAILPVLSVGAFLVASPTSAIMQPSVRELSSSADRTELAPVVFLLLDELPTQSLLDADGGIDPVRFPNLASLAGDGTWYRNHSAAATTTAQAIPAILTGNGPLDGAPLAATYPENLFTLLGPTHRLQVSESLTAMCPTRLCDDPDGSPAFVDQFGSLTADSTSLLLDRIRPERSAQPAMDDFAETIETLDADEVFGQLVSAPVRFTEFVDRLGGSGSAADLAAEVGATATDRAVADLDTVEPAGPGSVGPEPVAFVDAVALDPTVDPALAIDPGSVDPIVDPGVTVPADEAEEADETDQADEVGIDDRPTLSFLHLLLPHGPWRLYPDGQSYATTSYPVGDYDDSSDEPWIKALNQQRHLLQAEYADHLVGEILDTLKRTGAYDDSLIVAMADHGIAFDHGSDARLWSDSTVSQIAYSPLIIKAPGQVVGGPNDQNVSSLDVLPTVADLLGVRVPWPTEGSSVTSIEALERDGRKRIVDRGSWLGPVERRLHEFQMDETAPSAAARWIGPATRAAEVTAATGLLDGLLEPLHVTPFLRQSLADLDRRSSPDDPLEADELAAPAVASATLVPPAPAAEPEGLVRGIVTDAPSDAVVLVAVDGTVVTAAPIIVLDGQDGTILALLPPDALARSVDRTSVEIALVTGAGTDAVAVHRVAIAP
jgi:hypothetical protein